MSVCNLGECELGELDKIMKIVLRRGIFMESYQVITGYIQGGIMVREDWKPLRKYMKKQKPGYHATYMRQRMNGYGQHGGTRPAKSKQHWKEKQKMQRGMQMLQ